MTRCFQQPNFPSPAIKGGIKAFTDAEVIEAAKNHILETYKDYAYPVRRMNTTILLFPTNRSRFLGLFANTSESRTDVSPAGGMSNGKLLLALSGTG
jgi:hypothetical protein